MRPAYVSYARSPYVTYARESYVTYDSHISRRFCIRFSAILLLNVPPFLRSKIAQDALLQISRCGHRLRIAKLCLHSPRAGHWALASGCSPLLAPPQCLALSSFNLALTTLLPPSFRCCQHRTARTCRRSSRFPSALRQKDSGIGTRAPHQERPTR